MIHTHGFEDGERVVWTSFPGSDPYPGTVRHKPDGFKYPMVGGQIGCVEGSRQVFVRFDHLPLGAVVNANRLSRLTEEANADS